MPSGPFDKKGLNVMWCSLALSDVHDVVYANGFDTVLTDVCLPSSLAYAQWGHDVFYANDSGMVLTYVCLSSSFPYQVPSDNNFI